MGSILVIAFMVAALIWTFRQMAGSNSSASGPNESHQAIEPSPDRERSVGIGECKIDTAIEYIDYAGKKTKRKITIMRVTACGSGWVYLESYCHTAKAARTFRADRVAAFIDKDGVVSDPRSFVVGELRVPLIKSEFRVSAI